MANHSTESLLGLDGLEHVSWYEYRSPRDRLDWNPYKFTVAQDLRAMSTPTRPEDGLYPHIEARASVAYFQMLLLDMFATSQLTDRHMHTTREK